ncbi:MAG: YigZ family protein [Eubacteriales bacterium]|nr:YigZ family protein [Eubacteriales bacterium]
MLQLLQIQYEEKKSKFYGFLYSLESEEEVKIILFSLKEEHPKAKHILYAYYCPNRYGAPISGGSEDGEPISSMKKTKAILEKAKENYGIFLVRYYGGTNLGASHLDQVYFTLAMRLFQARKETKTSVS